MLINCIAMVEVMNDQSFHIAQFREDRFQSMSFMHGAQRNRGMRQSENVPKRGPEGMLRFDPGSECRHCAIYALLRVGSERQTVSAHKFEEPHHEAGVGLEAERNPKED